MIHALAEDMGGEFTICGMSYDAFETGDSDDPIVFAKVGQIVTCLNCRRNMDWILNNFKKYKYLGFE